MAEDARLLEQMERGQTGPVLRFYEWSEPTVSLGFHQSLDVLDIARLTRDHVPWTHRPSGGAAVLHSEELTYAIVMPFDGTSIAAVRIQEHVSRALTDGLKRMGVRASIMAKGEPLSALHNRVSCFVRTSRWEVTAGGRKIVGSAQRKRGIALLQHGSILIGNDHLRIADYLKISDETVRQTLRMRLEENATSIKNELGHPVAISDLRQVMAASFTEVFSNVYLEDLVVNAEEL